jgi:succinyl-CoA synthetase beta subunit
LNSEIDAKNIYTFPEIEELDINPLMVLEEGKGVFTVDVKIGVKRNGHSLS